MQCNAERLEISAPPRTATRKRSQKRKGCRSGQKRKFNLFASQLAVTPPAALTLPSITTVPPTLVNQKTIEATSRIALSMLDLCMSRDEDANVKTSALFIEKAFIRWVNEKASHLKNVQPHFCLSDTLETFGECHPKESGPTTIVGISFSQDKAMFYSLKDKVGALEAIIPGLGETALSTLYGWIHKVMFAITPNYLLDLVQYHYWHGEDNEEDAMIMAADYEGLEVGEVELAVTLADFEQEYPKWVYQPSEKMNHADLERLAADPPPAVAEIVKHLLSAPDMEKWTEDAWPTFLSDLSSDNECIGYGVMLGWDNANTNIMCRTCDDWMEYAYQGNCTDLYALYMAPQDTEGLKSLFSRFESYIKALTWVDRTISLLGVNNN